MSEILIYTDGGMRERCAGWGFYGIDSEGDEYESFGAAGRNVSNNVAELLAIIKALEFALTNDYTSISILTDSEYAIRCMNAVDTLEENGYDNVKNAEYRKLLSDLKNKVLAKEVTLVYNWNKGHSGIVGNERADVLATRGVIAQQNDKLEVSFIKLVKGKEIVDKSDKIKIEPPTSLITGKKWFFRTNVESKLADGRYIYCSTSFKEDKKIGLSYAGKPASDTHFSVTLTKEPFPVLEKIVTLFNGISNTEICSVLCNLKLIKGDKIWKELTRAPDTFMNVKSSAVFTPEKEIIGLIIKPPKLVWRLVDYFKKGIDMIEWLETKRKDVLFFDCTNQFINISKNNKKTIVPSFKSCDRVLVIKGVKLDDGRVLDVQLNTTIDIPDRNQINKIVNESGDGELIFNLVIWDVKEMSYQCGLIVKTEGAITAYYTGEASYRIIS